MPQECSLQWSVGQANDQDSSKYSYQKKNWITNLRLEQSQYAYRFSNQLLKTLNVIQELHVATGGVT